MDGALNPFIRELAPEKAVDVRPRNTPLRRETPVPRKPEDEKEFSGKLPFRSDPDTHRKIASAAKRSNKSINAWMEEVLREAADDVLGQEKVEINSDAIRQLIDNPDYAVKLVEDIATYLKEWNPPFVLRVNAALKQLLIGLDAVIPFLRDETTELSSESVQHLLEQPSPTVAKLTFAFFSSSEGEDRLFFRQFSAALKKFLLGLAAVKPFLKEEKTDSALCVIEKIEILLKAIESETSHYKGNLNNENAAGADDT